MKLKNKMETYVGYYCDIKLPAVPVSNDGFYREIPAMKRERCMIVGVTKDKKFVVRTKEDMLCYNVKSLIGKPYLRVDAKKRID